MSQRPPLWAKPRAKVTRSPTTVWIVANLVSKGSGHTAAAANSLQWCIGGESQVRVLSVPLLRLQTFLAGRTNPPRRYLLAYRGHCHSSLARSQQPCRELNGMEKFSNTVWAPVAITDQAAPLPVGQVHRASWLDFPTDTTLIGLIRRLSPVDPWSRFKGTNSDAGTFLAHAGPGSPRHCTPADLST